MKWTLSHRAHDPARRIADRHYNRQSPGSPQFVPPGRCLVLLSEDSDAFWVTSWPFPQYVKHAWPGAWVCSAFRNEGPSLASELIVQAVAATAWKYGPAPENGMVTFVDTKKVRPTMVRGVPTWGWVYLKAGFVNVGFTKGGLVALQLTPERMPPAAPPLGQPLNSHHSATQNIFDFSKNSSIVTLG